MTEQQIQELAETFRNGNRADAAQAVASDPVACALLHAELLRSDPSGIDARVLLKIVEMKRARQQ